MNQVPVQPDSTSLVTLSQLDELNQLFDKLPKEGLYVSLAIGILLYIIGWFGGTRFTLNKVIWCIVITLLVSVFSFPIAVSVFKWLVPGMGITFAFTTVYVLWCVFLLGAALSLYETLIVTAEEGRPN